MSAIQPTYMIRIGGIETMASIGIHGFEKTARQKLLVSVALLLPKPKAINDNAANVLDYDFVREGVLKLAADRHFNLQETFCEAVLDICMAQHDVLGAVVQTDKPDVYPAVASVSCRMARGLAEEPGYHWWSLNL